MNSIKGSFDGTDLQKLADGKSGGSIGSVYEFGAYGCEPFKQPTPTLDNKLLPELMK